MGGMFYGQVGLGGGVNNHIRSIQTKSGIKVLMNDDEKIVTILDPSGNTYFMDGSGNITLTAPYDITFNAGANMNINVGQNLTTIIGSNQSTTVAQNQINSVGMAQNESVGAIKNVTVGGNFITNVMGKMVEMITGNKESHTEKDRLRTTNGKVEMQSQGVQQMHSEKEVQNNSGEKSKNH